MSNKKWPTRLAASMAAGKNCSNFWGQNAAKVAKNVAEPILAPESRFRGIRRGNRHGFSRSIRSDWPQGAQNLIMVIPVPDYFLTTFLHRQIARCHVLA